MKLVVEQGPLAGQTVALDRPVLLVGRGKESALVLAEQGVSRQHARLERSPQGWTVTDLGTTNGTFVNGRQLPPREPHLLRPGDRLTIGSSVLAFRAAEAPAGTPVRQEGRAGSSRPGTRTASPSMAMRIVGAVIFVCVLAIIVALLVILLQPAEEELATPTPIDQTEQIMTIVPTEFQDIVTSVVPLVPTGLPLLPFGATATPPPPGAALPPSPNAESFRGAIP